VEERIVSPDAGGGPHAAETPPAPDLSSQQTPLSLLERLRANEPDAWSRLVQLYRPLVLSWCRRGGVPDADAEDVAQEVFAATAGGLARFRRDRPGDTFRGWLRTVTRNQVLLHFRKNRGRPQAEGGSDAWQQLQGVADPLADDAGDGPELSQLYRRAVEQVRGQFEESTWRAFWLSAIEGRSPATLADELGMTAAAIRQCKSRVLRRLREEMGDVLD
jgi:RNA polymerase sigma-70 factor (ECF subfamily)